MFIPNPYKCILHAQKLCWTTKTNNRRKWNQPTQKHTRFPINPSFLSPSTSHEFPNLLPNLHPVLIPVYQASFPHLRLMNFQTDHPATLSLLLICTGTNLVFVQVTTHFPSSDGLFYALTLCSQTCRAIPPCTHTHIE